MKTGPSSASHVMIETAAAHQNKAAVLVLSLQSILSGINNMPAQCQKLQGCTDISCSSKSSGGSACRVEEWFDAGVLGMQRPLELQPLQLRSVLQSSGTC